MELTLYQVDAFTSELFGGNPAAVVPLEQWLPDDLMQRIAAENNLSETAFFVERDGVYNIRWFAPLIEIPLCGHATLASAHVLFEHLDYGANEIHFKCSVGDLKVRKTEAGITMNFPSQTLESESPNEKLSAALGKKILETYSNGVNCIAVLESQSDVESCEPNFSALKEFEFRSINVTAPGEQVDFVSRFFAPKIGIDEDPVTGSAHTRLIPFWSKRLGKTSLSATQLSPRKGELNCSYLEDRVEMSGEAKTYLIGKISL